MKSMLLVLAVAFLAQDNKAPGTVSGTVRRFGTGEFVANVKVTIAGPRSATTDRQGQFVIKDVPPGTYYANAQFEGYFLPPKTTSPQKFVVAPGQNVNNLNFELVQGGAIRGRLSTPDGDPLPGILVIAAKPSYFSGQRQLGPAGNGVQTDDRGNFRIFGIEPGDYFVIATSSLILSAGTDERMKMTKTFFPGALSEDSAVRVKVTSGGESTADFHMQSSAKVKVSGTVTNNVPSSTLLGSYELVPRNIGTLVVGPQMFISPPKGRTFELRDVDPGSYDLYARAYVPAGPAGQARTFIGRTIVDVGSEDLNGVTVAIQPNVDITGRVVLDAAGAPPLPANLHLSMRAKGTVSSIVNVPSPRIDASGGFVAASVPEMDYQISNLGLFVFPIGAYLADIRRGDKSILDDGFFTATSGAAPLEIIVRLNGGTVEGTVRDSAGKPVAVTPVSLVPAPARRLNPLLYKRAVTDADGHFIIQGVTPGDYKLFAWDTLPAGADESPDFMKKYDAIGQPVSVKAAATASLSAVMIPAESQ
jgi:hypothetical protein